MIYIIICDDDSILSRSVEEKIRSYIEQSDEKINKKTEYEITRYNDAEALAHDIEEGKMCDILLLDIEMPELNGMEAARRIRKKLPQMLLLFLSGYEKYVFDVFELATFRFIPKNQMEERLEKNFLEALEKVENEKEQFFCYIKSGEEQRIQVSDILYIQRQGKNAIVKTFDGEVSIRKALKDIYPELPEGEFLWANRSVLCNISKIKRMEKMILFMKDDSKIEVARERVKMVGQEINNYWTKTRKRV